VSGEDNERMIAIVHMLCGPVFFVLFVLALRQGFRGFVSSIRGDTYIDRWRNGGAGFLVYWSLGMLVGLLSTATAP
jgi:hypothetical protein